MTNTTQTAARLPVAGAPATMNATRGFNHDEYLKFVESGGHMGFIQLGVMDSLNEMARAIHNANIHAGWWTDITTGEPLARNVPEMLCLIHSEISEAMEGHRKGLMDDKLPDRSMLEVELADAMIRIFDLAGAMGFQIGGAIFEKLMFNDSRADHKIENRLQPNGKKF